MSAQKQIESLVSEIKDIFDLDELESKIYLNLLKTGPITASAMAKNLDVDRAGMYRTVEKMTNKGIISSTLSSPKLITPLEPKKALRQVLQKKEREINKMQLSGKAIIEKINNQIAIPQEYKIPTFKVVQGKDNIYTEIAQMIENCTDTAFIATNIEDLKDMINSIIPSKIKICQENGGKVLFLIEGEKNQVLSVTKNFDADEIRICNLPSRGRIAVCKNIRMIMSDATKLQSDSSFDYSVSTNAKDMIENIDNLCRLMWKSGKPVNDTNKKNKS